MIAPNTCRPAAKKYAYVRVPRTNEEQKIKAKLCNADSDWNLRETSIEYSLRQWIQQMERRGEAVMCGGGREQLSAARLALATGDGRLDGGAEDGVVARDGGPLLLVVGARVAHAVELGLRRAQGRE